MGGGTVIRHGPVKQLLAAARRISRRIHIIAWRYQILHRCLEKMEKKNHPAIVIPTSPSKHLIHHHIVHLDVQKLFHLIIFLSSLLLLPHPLAAERTSFHYLDFKDSSNICFQGNVSVKEAGAIQLSVKDLAGSVGLAYYCDPIYLWNATTGELADFATNFTFGVSSIAGTTRGGGVAFFLSEDPTIPQGGRGNYLGLGKGAPPQFSSRFIAVEFDSRHNNWDPNDSRCHVGIDINSLESVKVAKMWNDIFIPGPQGRAQVVFNSISNYLMVSLQYNQTLYGLSHMVDLRSELPEQVYVGFSLATDQSQDPKNITSWSFEYSTLDNNNNSEASSKKKKIGVLIVVIAVPLLVISVAGIFYFIYCKSKRAKHMDKNVGENKVEGGYDLPTTSSRVVDLLDPPLHDPQHNNCTVHVDDEFEDRGPRRISFEHLVAATDNFHESRRLGKGAFGGVYRGFLKDLNREAAIKRIEEYSEHGEKEFAAEVKTISRLRHRNLVQLIGFCHEGRELLLVYDFMPNGSLDYHLFDNGNKVLSWPRRRNIVLGLASALQYLHEGLDKCIVHRDIKPSNILLDSEFNPKLADFGLARMTSHGSTLESTMMAGTMGYMAPEYFLTGKASKEADVYSFGIIALELATGRRAMEPKEKGREMLLHWIWELYEKGMIMHAVDKKLGATSDEHEAKQLMMVGLWCAHPEACSRPSFIQVISTLNFEFAVPDLNINLSTIAQLRYTLLSGMSSSTKSSNGWRSNNDGKSDSSQVTN